MSLVASLHPEEKPQCSHSRFSLSLWQTSEVGWGVKGNPGFHPAGKNFALPGNFQQASGRRQASPLPELWALGTPSRTPEVLRRDSFCLSG